MKKNISINLQGMIFHIEEDGYEVLHQYLNSIKVYFASYPGHQEIIADIESRMAEIFYTNLTPSKQVITLEDVEALIRKMGSVNDFAQIEEEEFEEPQARNYQNQSGTFNGTDKTVPPKRLYRNMNRKVIAGVAAGIADYMGTEPAWVRLILVLLVVVIAPITAGISAGFIILMYILCWIALPKNYEAPAGPYAMASDTTSRKLFRNPDDKKLGGVCSGLGLYLGIDPAIVRLLFLVSFFIFGGGLFIYLLLWIILPEAKTVTEKAQMQGKPLTLSGIESSLKNSLQPDGATQEESPLVRLILLPVRLIAQILAVLSRLLAPVVSVLLILIRIFAGVLLLVLSLAGIVALITTFGASFGYFLNSGMVNLDGVPATYYFGDYPVAGKIAALIAGLIPCFFFMILAIGLLTKRFFLKASVGWSLFAVWLLSGFIFLITLISYHNNFEENGEYITEKRFSTAQFPVITLDANKIKGSTKSDFELEVESFTGPEVLLQQTFRSEGRSEEDAIKNARMLAYRAVQKDSVITLDNGFTFRSNAIYRDQNLLVTLRLPETKNYRISHDLARLLPGAAFDQNYSNAQIARNTWKIKNNIFSCLSCTAADSLEVMKRNNTEFNPEDMEDGNFLREADDFGSDTRSFDVRNFRKVSIVGPFYVKISEGKPFSAEARGNSDDLSKIKFEVEDGTLKIYPRRSGFNSRNQMEPVYLAIQMPDISELSLVGATTAEVTGFRNDRLKLNQTGATRTYLHLETRNLNLNLTGASQATLVGKADFLEADLVGGCQLNAAKFTVNQAELDVVGGSEANVNVTERLKADVNSGSELTYSGSPASTDIDKGSGGKVKKESRENWD